MLLYKNLWLLLSLLVWPKMITLSGLYFILSCIQWMTGKNSCFGIFRSFSTDRGFEFAEGEPSSELGKKKGLVILLDAHSDILSPGVNFTNILRAAFMRQTILCSFSLLIVWFLYFFWPKNIIAKAARNMFVNLTTGSVDSDFDGFTAVVGPKNSFPMLGYNGFEIKPGHCYHNCSHSLLNGQFHQLKIFYSQTLLQCSIKVITNSRLKRIHGFNE